MQTTSIVSQLHRRRLLIKRLTVVLWIVGILICALGIYGYMLGDLQISFLQETASRIKAAYNASLAAGNVSSPGDTIGYVVMKFAVVFILVGFLFVLNAIMIRIQSWERYKDYLCLQPAVVILALFVYYPVLDLVRISFTNWNLIKEEYTYVGLKNFNWLFNGSGLKYFSNSLKITAIYTFWEVLMALAGGMLLALLFNRMTRTFNALRALVFMPKYIATSTSAIVFIWILNGDYGILNYLLKLFGIVGPSWLNDADTALTGILFLTLWRVVGYSMMIYLSAMKSIPQDYYEAAAIDGADGVHRFRYITLPLLAPTSLFLFVTTFISSMKVFQSVDVMTSGGPYDATMVMVQWVYNLAFEDFRVDRAAVVSVIFFIILLVSTGATMKYSHNNVNYDQ